MTNPTADEELATRLDQLAEDLRPIGWWQDIQTIKDAKARIESLNALLARSAAHHRAMVLDLPGLLEDAGLSDEEHMCDGATSIADEIDRSLSEGNRRVED